MVLQSFQWLFLATFSKCGSTSGWLGKAFVKKKGGVMSVTLPANVCSWPVKLIPFPRGALAGHIWVSPKQGMPFLFWKWYDLQGLLSILDEKLSQQHISKWDISAKAFICCGVELFFIQHPVFSNSDQVKDTQTHTHLFAREDCRWCRISGILNNRDLNDLIYMVAIQKKWCFWFIVLLGFVSRKGKERWRKD